METQKEIEEFTKLHKHLSLKKIMLFLIVKKYNKKLMIGSIATMLALPTTAQINQELKQIELNPVVITGTGTYHKADNSPVAVKVISAKQLKDAGVTSLEDALSRLSSNITTQTNGMGTFINFNGVSDDYLLILENGKRLSGDDRWNRVNINRIKRIEIFSGAASALYGSDAIAGVINIITEENEDGIVASSLTKLRNHGRYDQDINLDINLGNFSSHTAYDHHKADNWQVNPYQSFEEQLADGSTAKILKLTGRPMSTGFYSNNLSEKIEWKFNKQWSVYLNGNYYVQNTQRPQSATYFTQKATTDKSTGVKTYKYTEKQAYTYDIHHQSYTYGGGMRWVPNEQTHLYLDVFSDNATSKYDYWQTAEKEGYGLTRKRTHHTEENLKGIFRLTPWNKLSAGVQFVQETLSSSSDNIDFETTNSYNIYAQDEVNIVKGLDGIIGVRYTYNDQFGNHFTPNVGLFYHARSYRVRANYAGGYRTPSLSQLYATDQAKTTMRHTENNTALKPEKNHFWNVNAEWGNQLVNISVNGFINRISDMINYRTLTQTEIDGNSHLTQIYNDGWTTIRKRDNIDKADIKGMSAHMKFFLPAGFTLGAGYTYTYAQAKSMTLNSKTQTYEIKETPVDKSVKNVANANLTWDKNWNNYHLNICLNGHVQGPRYSSTYGYASGYGIWNLSTHHTFIMRQATLEPGLGIENIFNKRDNSYWNSNFSTINPGRTLYVSLAIRFNN